MCTNRNNQKDEIKVNVWSSSLNFNHLGSLTTQLRGLERKMVGNTLTEMKPMRRRETDVLLLTPTSIELGNYNGVKSDSVYRKIRSEQLAKNDRDKNDLYDLIGFQREHPEFVYSVGVPFFVHIFSKEQLMILQSLPDVILHLDATGSIIRKPFPDSKRVYYCAGVVQVTTNNTVCAVMEMVTCNHDAISIASWLFNFKCYFLSNKNKWPVFRKVVVDFSFAYINAINLAWNNIDMASYLQITFDFVNKGKELPENFIQIQLCCFHIF